MTDTSLIDAFHQVFGPVPYRLPHDPTSDLDEDTLRRSRPSIRTAAESYRPRHLQPVEPWRDEVGAATSGSDSWEAAS